MALKIIWNNIVNEPADVIVTPASRKPGIGTGLDKVIHEVGGKKLTEARMKLGTIEPGVVKSTPSYGLAKAKCKARHVIHALGPWCEAGKLDGTERPILFGCYLQILCTAVALKAKTVSIPVMSSGKFGMPMPLAVDTAVEAIQLFLKAFSKLKVKLVGIDREFLEYAVKKHPKLVERRFDERSELDYRKGHKRFRGEDGANCGETFGDREDSDYFSTMRLRRETADKSFKRLFLDLWQAANDKARREWKAIPRNKRPEKSPGAYLLRREDLAARSGVSDWRIKHCLSLSSLAAPPRDTIVLLSLAMGVRYEYFEALLRKCKYPVILTELSARDRLVMEMYRDGKSRYQIDEALRREGELPLKRD